MIWTAACIVFLALAFTLFMLTALELAEREEREDREHYDQFWRGGDR